MKNIPCDGIYKEVVIIGNGPSGIALSYMLAGSYPFVISNDHPDEMLSIRLSTALDQNLADQNLMYLTQGLEGRTTNPVSLLLDSLVHPCADLGLEIEPLVEWRKCEPEIDHIVLGKGPPGGSWHAMDPNILTLSLGSWMALPGLPYQYRDSGEKRAFASNVAHYYTEYVEKMGLSKYFKNGTIVTKVIPLNQQEIVDCDRSKVDCKNFVKDIDDAFSEKHELYVEPEIGECLKYQRDTDTCMLANAFNFLLLRSRRQKNRCCKRPRESIRNHDLSPDRKKINDKSNNKNRSISFSCDFPNFKSRCDNLCSRFSNNPTSDAVTLKNSQSLDFGLSQVPCWDKTQSRTQSDLTVSGKNDDDRLNWFVEALDIETGEYTAYFSKYLVLACGASDSPNRLSISAEDNDPEWLLHDLRSLEDELDKYKEEVERDGGNLDPVVVVGAGLSAADAVIATRGRNIPVIHVFRNKSAGLNKQLPENMYPEYHTVHQMMKDGGSSYPLYTALPEYNLKKYDDETRIVTLTSADGEQLEYRVSFVAVLIGSRPDLSFLPKEFNLGVNKNRIIDCKTNTLDIDKFTHCVNGIENLFAIGPLAGDNFVRFIPGGALAIVSELKRRNSC